MNEHVHVRYHIAEDVLDPSDVRGGIRLDVDGTRINRSRDGERTPGIHPWNSEYAGEYIHTDMKRLVDCAREFAAGEPELYEHRHCHFKPSPVRFTVEAVGPRELRVAYRTRLGSGTLPTPEAARGYVVDRCDFCRAVSSAAHEYFEELRSMSLEYGDRLMNEFEASLEDLDTALETCAETPPTDDTSE